MRVSEDQTEASPLEKSGPAKPPGSTAPVWTSPVADIGSDVLARAESIAGKYAPAYLVLDHDHNILHGSGRIERYLEPVTIPVLRRVLDVIRVDLRGELRVLLTEAAAAMNPMRASRVSFGQEDAKGRVTPGCVDLVVEPIQGATEQESLLVVLFLDAGTEACGPEGAGLTAREAAAAARALHDSQERFRLMASIVPAFLFTMTPDLIIDYINHPFYEFTGLAEGGAPDIGWASVIHPDDIAENRRRWRVAASLGGVFEQEHRLRSADGSWRWFLSRSVPQHDAKGEVVQWFGSSIDIHQRRRAEARQRLLLAELQHRAKNILAVVRSLLSRTLESSTSLDDFAAHLSGRISALARTQSVLARTADGAVGLEELAYEEVVAHGGQEGHQVTIEGPTVMLTDKVAETMGLALHELATNALKFGGLSVPDGRVHISWDVQHVGPEPGGAKRLSMTWQESGLTLKSFPQPRSGFGRELIEHGLPYELGAETRLEFLPTGVRCDIELTLKTPPEGGPFASELT